MVIKLAESVLKTSYGIYQESLYYDGLKEIVVFTHGDVSNTEGVLCRIHSMCIYGHYVNSAECDCKAQMDMAQKLILQDGKGILFILDQEGKGNGHFALMKSKYFKNRGQSQADAYESAGFKRDARDFSKVAEILSDLNVKSIRLITDNINKSTALTQCGINVVGIKSATV